jgi:hypothetical protein
MVTLTNVGTSYDAIAASRGLKVGLLNFTGLAQVVLLVRVNKVGTGTQSWQLWNETDGTELGVIDDAGAAGVKNLQSTFSVSLTGIKQCRVRAKSTVASDDPVFYDADALPVSA